jgi:hypothetical protein
MKSSPQSSEQSERPVRQADANTSAECSYEQAQLETLMKNGFEWEEAVRLAYLRDHLYTNSEMRQRMANDHRMQFARWLYEQGELQEM